MQAGLRTGRLPQPELDPIWARPWLKLAAVALQALQRIREYRVVVTLAMDTRLDNRPPGWFESEPFQVAQQGLLVVALTALAVMILDAQQDFATQ